MTAETPQTEATATVETSQKEASDTGAGLMEIFETEETPLETGTIRHFAFAVENTDACVEAVRTAGYEVFVEPKDIEIASEIPFPARIAFCRGPVGEEIEFFHEK